MWITLTVLVALLRIGNADDSTIPPCMPGMTTMEMTTMDPTMSPMPCYTTPVTTSTAVTVTTSSTTPTTAVTVTTISTTPTTIVTVTTMQANTTNSTANVTMTTAPATTVTTTITTTTPNWASLIDPSLKLLFTKLYPNSTIDPYMLYNMSRDPHVLIPFLDNITNSMWTANCDATTNFLNYLISIFVTTGNKVLVTEDRVKKVVVCKADCNFATLFQANYTSNVTTFLKGTIPSMPKDAGALCAAVMSQFINITANLGPNSNIPLDTITSLLPDGSPVSSILTVSQMGRVSPADSAQLIKNQGSSIDQKSATALGANLFPNASFTDTVAASCCGPMDILKTAGAVAIGNRLSNMNIGLFSEKRMADTITIIMGDSTNRATVLDQIITFANPTLIAQIPLATALNLSSLATQPTLWPDSYALSKAASDFKSLTISSINVTSLSNILTAVGANWIKNTTGSDGITVALKVLTAATTSKFEMKLDQKKECSKNIFGTTPYNTTAVLATFEAMTSPNIALISNSLIESPFALLDILAQSSKFSQVITQNAKIPQSKCCKYLRLFRENYARVAIKYLTNGTTTATTVDILDSLGVCFAGSIPAAYMSSLTGASFMSRVSLFSNIVFQPSLATTQTVSTLLENYFAALSTSTSIDTAFNSLGSLAIFLSSTQLSRVSSTNYKSVASQVLPKIQIERDISNADVQRCRLYTDSDSDVISRISTINARFLSAITAASRKRRETTQYTCDQLTSLSGTLNQLTVSDITNSISTTEFYKCITLLGQTSNKWYSNQLTALAAKATAYYTSVSITSIPDTDISKLNSIMVGYTSTELSSLIIQSTGSVSTLGALNGWSAAQLTALAARVYAYNSNSFVSVFSYMGNIVCGMTDAELATIDSTTFSNSLTSTGKISNNACASLSSLYTKAKALPSYSTASSATVSALGSISGGITTADLGTLTADDMSSFSTTALAIMPAATVNTMSSTQISGLSSGQLNAMINSDNYSGYSDSVKTSLRVGAGGSSASTISINMLLLLACLVLSSIFRSQ